MWSYKIPKGIKIITWATTIRWVGWGFFESLLPVFMFSFANSFAETGFFKSVYYIFFLIAAPLAGILADRISTKVIILLGLAVYPLISLSYFWAGVSGMAVFIVIARALNGIGLAFDSVGRSTYFRLHSPKDKIATTIGYFDVITTIFWILAVLSSLYLIKIFEVHKLALAILPTTFIAIAMVLMVKNGTHEKLKDGVKNIWRAGIFKNILVEMKSWTKGIWLMGLANFFIGFVAVMGDFIIPIRVFQESGSLSKVIIIGAILALPGLFDFKLGQFADRHRVKSLIIGLSAMAGLFIILAFSESFYAQMLIAFLLGISFNLINLASDGLMTRIVAPEHYGRVSSLNFDFDTVGAILGPIAIGLMIDGVGFSFASTVLALASLIIIFIFFLNRRFLIENK